MNFLFSHMYIFLSILFAVCSQLIIKWKMTAYSLDDSTSITEKFIFAASMLMNPYIILSIILTLLSGLSWMIAMTKFEISYAYPFTILGFVFVLILSALLFNESLNWQKIVGVLLIFVGIFVISSVHK